MLFSAQEYLLQGSRTCRSVYFSALHITQNSSHGEKETALNMALHPGIPPQKGRVDFGLDSPISEDSVTALSQKEKKIEILWNNKNSFHTMVLAQQGAELKYSPFKVIPYERGPQTGMRWKENQAWYRHFSLC